MPKVDATLFNVLKQWSQRLYQRKVEGARCLTPSKLVSRLFKLYTEMVTAQIKL